MEIVPIVLNDVQKYATIRSGESSSGQYLLDVVNDVPLDAPATLRISEKSARAYVLKFGENSEEEFPGSTPEEAGLAYLLIHLDETFATKVGAGTTVTVAGNRLIVTDPVQQDWPELDPDGEYYWSADKPDDFS